MASNDSDHASASMVASDGKDSGSNGTALMSNFTNKSEEWQILSGLEFSSDCEGQIIERRNHTRKRDLDLRVKD
jgi:hypothetical protein